MKDWDNKNAKAILVEVYTNHKNLESKFDKLYIKLFGEDDNGGAFGKLEDKFAGKWVEKLIGIMCLGCLFWMGRQLLYLVETAKALIQ